MIKPTTSYLFIYFFFATTGFVVLLSPSKIIFWGVFPRFQKNPKIEVSWESLGELRQTRRNANNVIGPPPPHPPPRAMILRVFIPLWRIRRCSRTGATLARGTASPEFRLGVIFT